MTVKSHQNLNIKLNKTVKFSLSDKICPVCTDVAHQLMKTCCFCLINVCLGQQDHFQAVTSDIFLVH